MYIVLAALQNIWFPLEDMQNKYHFFSVFLHLPIYYNLPTKAYNTV